MTKRKPGRPPLRWLRVRCPRCHHTFGFRYKLSWIFRDVFASRNEETYKEGEKGIVGEPENVRKAEE